ncbi:bifunctional phosphopantothenoylcysteine decarboxylase/phosphopantothenate synthase [mine drainage metagenome]|uniref:Bifunctional phosphopantothenoylcysteine decarboxylase/phosphopantothenate synthase n=1 Tax=mine drainage metagenome TaxID=410659 RepID=A0A1J5QLH1_9ZZZZ
MALKEQRQRLAWALTGSGHYLKECLDIIDRLPDVDLFLSRAAAEILQQYGYQHNVGRVFQDKTASAVPVELFYHGVYHTVVVAPSSSNTVAKMVCGISDNLVTNIFAQAGKCRIPTIVFACDTEPELESDAPRENVVKVYPRRIDLDNMEKLKSFEATTVAGDMASLEAAIQARLACLKTFSS